MPIYRIPADISELQIAREQVVLDDDCAAGATTLTVKDIGTVAVNQFLLLRGIGGEKAEIVTTHASTAPSGTTITLIAAGTKYAHPAGTIAYVVAWDQIQFFHSATEDDANSDATNLSSLASASNIDVTEERNYYSDSTQTSGYYYWRFSDSVNAVNGLYSDPIPWGQFKVQWEQDEIGDIAETVRNELNHEWNDRFDFQAAIKSGNRCLEYMSEELNHWSQYLKPDYKLGATSRGIYSYTLPSDIYDDTSNRSILNIKIDGVEDWDWTYVDEREWDELFGDTVVTQVRTAASANDATLEIDNSYGFDSSGSVHVYTSNTDDVITYTGVTRSSTAGVLTGIATDSSDGAIGASHAVDTNVWQNPVEGRPRYWTIKDGKLYIWPLPDSGYINLNIVLDYYREATKLDSGSDSIDAPRWLPLYYWLRWEMWSVLYNDGEKSTKHSDFVLFNDRLRMLKRNTKTGQKFKMRPKINSIDYNRRKKGRFIET